MADHALLLMIDFARKINFSPVLVLDLLLIDSITWV